jgi:hypothetical protein
VVKLKQRSATYDTVGPSFSCQIIFRLLASAVFTSLILEVQFLYPIDECRHLGPLIVKLHGKPNDFNNSFTSLQVNAHTFFVFNRTLSSHKALI